MQCPICYTEIGGKSGDNITTKKSKIIYKCVCGGKVEV